MLGGTARGEEAYDVLVAGQSVAGLGQIDSLSPTACLGDDGRVVAEVIGTSGGRALACVDGDGAAVLVRDGDPSPRGGVFYRFDDCALLPDGSLYFAALRRTAEGAASRDIYHADAGGITSVVGGGDLASNGTLLHSIGTLSGGNVPGLPTFTANDRGTVLTRARIAAGPTLVRVRRGLPPELFHAVANTGQPWLYGNRNNAALAADDTIVAFGSLANGEAAIFALDTPDKRTLFSEADIASQLGFVDTIHEQFFDVRMRGSVLAFHLEWVDATREWQRAWIRYSPARGFAPIVAAGEHDAGVVIDISRDGRTLIAAYRYGDGISTDTEYRVVTDDGVETIAADHSGYAFPNALAINDRGNVLFQTAMRAGSARQRLSAIGPTPDSAARCVVPPRAIEPTPSATATETPTATPRPTKTPSPPIDCVASPERCVRLRVGSAAGVAGEVVSIAVTLNAPTRSVAGVQADLPLLEVAPVGRNADGTPACHVDRALRKLDSSFAFQPPGCTDACTGVRALVLAFDNVDPIPDRSRVFTCALRIDPLAAEGSHPLALSGVGAADPRGNAIPVIAAAGTLRIDSASDRATTDGAAAGSNGCQVGPLDDDPRTLCLLAMGALAAWASRRVRRVNR